MVCLDKIFADHEAHAYTLRVLLGRALQFAEHTKQAGHLRFRDSAAIVDHVNLELFLHPVVSRKDFDGSLPGEF